MSLPLDALPLRPSRCCRRRAVDATGPLSVTGRRWPVGCFRVEVFGVVVALPRGLRPVLKGDVTALARAHAPAWWPRVCVEGLRADAAHVHAASHVIVSRHLESRQQSYCVEIAPSRCAIHSPSARPSRLAGGRGLPAGALSHTGDAGPLMARSMAPCRLRVSTRAPGASHGPRPRAWLRRSSCFVTSTRSRHSALRSRS